MSEKESVLRDDEGNPLELELATRVEIHFHTFWTDTNMDLWTNSSDCGWVWFDKHYLNETKEEENDQKKRLIKKHLKSMEESRNNLPEKYHPYEGITEIHYGYMGRKTITAEEIEDYNTGKDI